MKKPLFVFLLLLLCFSSCNMDDNQEVFKPQTVDITDTSAEEVTVSSMNQEIILKWVKGGNLYGLMPLENRNRSITKYRSNRNPLGSYIFEAEDDSFSFSIADLELGAIGKYMVYCLQRMVFDINTDMILDFAKPELFHDFAGNRVYMNYYQVDMKDPGKYGIENPERVTFVDMILDADGETSAYIFEDIPEAKLSWFGVHDFSNIDSFRFLMLAKAEGNCDGQWQIAMRTPVRIDIGDVVNLVSPATYEIDNTVDDLVLEFSIPEKSNVYRNYTVEFFPVDPDDGKIFHKAAVNVGDEKIVIHVGKLDYPVYFESYWWNGESDVTYGEIENGLKLRAVSEEEQTFLEQGRMEFSENNPECSFPLKSISSGKDEIMVKGFFEFADGYDPEKVRVSVEFSEGLEASCHLVATSPNNQGVYNRGGSFSIDMRRDERPVEAFVSIKGIHTVADPVMTVRVEDISR